MKISSEQLSAHIKKQVLPVYLIAGDEPLIVQESASQVRDFLESSGYEERISYQVDSTFDWSQIEESSQNLSLFSEKKIIELNIGSGKLGQSGAKKLNQLLEIENDDICWLLTGNKLEAAQQNSAWCKVIVKKGLYAQVWPIQGQRLPAWIRQRISTYQLNLAPEAIALIAELTEGNLLASQQAIDLLVMIFKPGQRVGVDDIKAVLADDTRFNIFELVDQLLNFEAAKASHIIKRLKQEDKGSVPLLIWALTRELRSLIQMSELQAKGQSVEQVMNAFKVWPKRKPLIKKALTQRSLAHWHRLLSQLADVDCMAKGAKPGDAWQALSLACANWCSKNHILSP